MNESPGFEFVGVQSVSEQTSKILKALVIPKTVINAEIKRLASIPTPTDGRRVSYVSNRLAGPGNGLTPGIAVSICVLNPGEKTKPIRHNSSLVSFCIQGAGSTVVDGRRFDYRQFDLWTTPPWSVYQHYNDTDAIQVRLTYSNSPLLEKLGVHIVDEPKQEQLEEFDSKFLASEQPTHNATSNPYGTFRLTEDGAFLMPYEILINPSPIDMKPLLWPWQKVQEELDKLRNLGQRYQGRRLYLLYDPATGRTNGTTSSFFAAITIRPGNIVDRPHRHVSAAINYYFAGSGYSIVDGNRYEWEAGDLMLSAPGWAVHNHASNERDVYELTIQDQPFHIAMGSLLWQESLQEQPKALGIQKGFATNRSSAVESRS
jgi:gentisate 1,2-dioxygenase